MANKSVILTKETARYFFTERGSKGFFVLFEDGSYSKVTERSFESVKKYKPIANTLVVAIPLSEREMVDVKTDSKYFWFEKLDELRTIVKNKCNTKKYCIKIQ